MSVPERYDDAAGRTFAYKSKERKIGDIARYIVIALPNEKVTEGVNCCIEFCLEQQYNKIGRKRDEKVLRHIVIRIICERRYLL